MKRIYCGLGSEFYEYPGVEGYTVIFGHTPTPNLRNKKEFSIWHDPIYKDKIGIDWVGRSMKVDC